MHDPRLRHILRIPLNVFFVLLLAVVLLIIVIVVISHGLVVLILLVHVVVLPVGLAHALQHAVHHILQMAAPVHFKLSVRVWLTARFHHALRKLPGSRPCLGVSLPTRCDPCIQAIPTRASHSSGLLAGPSHTRARAMLCAARRPVGHRRNCLSARCLASILPVPGAARIGERRTGQYLQRLEDSVHCARGLRMVEVNQGQRVRQGLDEARVAHDADHLCAKAHRRCPPPYPLLLAGG
mmetsp:Transcript_35760/g.84785  ORF Transcript_35760/g.84785 Transcript_35760/m.84785 type:complete len:238 (+) Transcript_35760:717-1430(+)